MIFKRAMAALAVIAVAVFGPQAPALAGSGTIPAPAAAPGNPTGYFYVDYVANTLRVSVRAEGLPAGYCITTYLDIMRTPGDETSHYDIRAARTCQPHSSRDSGLQHEGSTYGVDIIGVQKLSVCYGPINQRGTCNDRVGGPLSNVEYSFNSGNECSRAWTRAASGRTFYFSGGDPTDCND